MSSLVTAKAVIPKATVPMTILLKTIRLTTSAAEENVIWAALEDHGGPSGGVWFRLSKTGETIRTSLSQRGAKVSPVLNKHRNDQKSLACNHGNAFP